MAAKRRSMADLLAETGLDEANPAVAPEPESATTGATAPASPLQTPVLSDPARVPVPYDGHTTGELDDRERADLEVCEAAIDNLRRAFWAAGKALQVIRDARLYRSTHDTFEAYVADRWDMRTSHAYRLIQAWPLAEALSPIGDKINEAQVRELLPLADRHGKDAAVTVYEAVAEVVQENGGRITAAVLGEVVRALPAEWNPAEAVEQIRKYLAGDHRAGGGIPDPAEEWTRQAERVRATVRRAIDNPKFRAALRDRPDEARAVMAELRELLDEIERESMK